MQRRYWLFKGDFYYPSGGMDDFVGNFYTLEEATAVGTPPPGTKYGRAWDWAHVFDIETGKRIDIDFN